MAATILVIDDEASLRKLLTTLLRKEGHQVVVASDGARGLSAAQRAKPSLIILDLFLPGMSGHDICTRIRRTPSLRSIPVLILTAHDTEGQLAASLDRGADDYLAKPFDVSEFRARVRALLRRSPIYDPQPSTQKNDLKLDVKAHHALWKGRTLHLAPKEFDLLCRLVQESPRVISKRELAETVWEKTLDQMHHRTLDVHIHRIRRKLGARGMRQLKTVPVLGYQWISKAAS